MEVLNPEQKSEPRKVKTKINGTPYYFIESVDAKGDGERHYVRGRAAGENHFQFSVFGGNSCRESAENILETLDLKN